MTPVHAGILCNDDDDDDDKCDTSNNTGNWKDLIFIHKVTEQHTWKARQQGSTENNQTGYSTHASQSAYIKVQHDYNGK